MQLGPDPSPPSGVNIQRHLCAHTFPPAPDRSLVGSAALQLLLLEGPHGADEVLHEQPWVHERALVLRMNLELQIMKTY
ncbi:unnamed protein product [Merluccius merluccius]